MAVAPELVVAEVLAAEVPLVEQQGSEMPS